jgi:hypothetical protein
LLRASSASRTKPHLFTFNVRHTKGGLSHQLAHAEVPNPVPRTNHVAQPALKTPLEGVSTARLDDIDNLFVVGYSFHGLSRSSSFTLLF